MTPRCRIHKAEAFACAQAAGRSRSRGRGARGRAGRTCRRGSPQLSIMRRSAPARVRSKLKTELKLQGMAVVDDDDSGEDGVGEGELDEDAVEADFNEDVLDASDSDIEHAGDGVVACDSDSAADSALESVMSSPFDFDADVDQDNVPLADVDPAAGLSSSMRRCFQRWHITMAASLRALHGTAGNPRAEAPKRISLLQRGASVVWFAPEPGPSSPAAPAGPITGRIITVDGKDRAQYCMPGFGRQNIIDISSELASGTARFLLHTMTEHVKPRDQWPEMNFNDLLVARCWNTIIMRDDAASTTLCPGCHTPSPQCALCLSAMSVCCIEPEALAGLDIIRCLQTRLGAGIDVKCRDAPPAVHALLWDIRRGRDELLCSLCNAWLARRESD